VYLPVKIRIFIVRLLKQLDSRYGSRIQDLPFQGLARGMLSVLAHSGDVFVVAPALVLIWWFGDSQIRALAVTLAIGAFLSVAFIYTVKFSVRRDRPPGEWGSFYRRTDPYSFPSGHAAKTMTLAIIVLGTGRFWLGLLLLLWSALVGFARIALGVHYLSDVTVGYSVGMFVGIAATIVVRSIGILL
jgi:membrane-associated phospholipid phosphatase